jgi:methylglyoxal synthase
MAGRPFGQGGQPGLLYGVVVFAIVGAASLGLFIFQLTKNKAAENRAQTAEHRLDQYVGRGAPPYYVDEATARRTNVVAVMAEDLAKVAQLVTGGDKDVGATVLAKSEQVLTDIGARKPGTIAKGDTLLAALTRLGDLYAQAQSTADALITEMKRLREDNASLTARLKTQADQFDAQVASLSTQLNQTQGDKSRAVEQKDAQLRDLQATLDVREQQLQKLKREGSTVSREKDLEITQLEAVIADLQGKIRAIKPETFDPNAILTSADGRIMRAIPGSRVVYINLGAKDKIKPGMGFEIFSRTRESGSDLRGKASVEVVTAMEETAECRVTRSSRQPILEGDIVVNIAYERNRRPKFVVRGDFDLDYDGVTDYNGVEQITSLIRQWGGQVVDTLDESVDFVVIGLPPTGPSAAPDERASAVVRDQAQQKDLERSRFRAEIERAQKMFIPVITQNQFLFLTGFAGETAVAQR